MSGVDSHLVIYTVIGLILVALVYIVLAVITDGVRAINNHYLEEEKKKKEEEKKRRAA